jgi:hypothetical protein
LFFVELEELPEEHVCRLTADAGDAGRDIFPVESGYVIGWDGNGQKPARSLQIEAEFFHGQLNF